ncbi:hypothetical protein [Streptomyces omiyaensis]|uniref:hypothetical protein n=1 Tax=Streptomyces omiyaensis TaxID=68247 RepID=UPI0036FEDAB7
MGAHLPYPWEAEIRRLLADGHTNAHIARLTNEPVRRIARIRKDANVPPASRTHWAHSPHPQQRNIHHLLEAGHTNAEIHRRTGADDGTIARIRRELGIGPATIVKRGTRVHPRYDEIRNHLAHMSSTAIARELGVDKAAVRRIRTETGIEYTRPRSATPEEKWKTLVRPVDGGHLEWLGQRAGTSGTPVMKLRDQPHSPFAIAFQQRTGRAPVGQVRPECEHPHCVAPAHVEDQPGRIHLRSQLRAVLGTRPRPTTCRHGHDQELHGSFEPDGTSYCVACKSSTRVRGAAPATGSA